MGRGLGPPCRGTARGALQALTDVPKETVALPGRGPLKGRIGLLTAAGSQSPAALVLSSCLRIQRAIPSEAVREGEESWWAEPPGCSPRGLT